MPPYYRAAILRSQGAPLSIERAEPRELGPGDALVRIRATGLCHTDLEVIDGSLAQPLPIVLGHEAAGVIEAAGADVDSLTAGDPVVLSWNPHCGGCFYCERKLPILCEQYISNGPSAFDFHGAAQSRLEGGEPLHHLMYLGTFAEYCIVPAEQAIKVPRDIPFDRACLIGCGVMTGVGAALNIAHIESGSCVLVIGCGAVGLSAVQGARMAGASVIVAADPVSAKRELAKRLGATHDVDPSSQDVAAFVRSLTKGRGADVVLESAGRLVAFQTSAEAVRPGGEIVWLGKVNVDAEVQFRWGSLMQEKRIRRSSYGGAVPSRDFPLLAQRYLDGSLKLDELISRRIGLDDINAGLADLRSGAAIRSVVVFEA